MNDRIPTVRQVHRKDGTVYQAVRHMKVAKMESGKKTGWTPPQVAGTDQLSFANIHHSLHERGYSSENISFAIDVAMDKAELPANKLTSSSIMNALNDCVDTLGEKSDFGARETNVVAERLIVMSLNRIPYGERVKKLVVDPEIDLNRLVKVMKEDGITDPAQVEAIFKGVSNSLLDGVL